LDFRAIPDSAKTSAQEMGAAQVRAAAAAAVGRGPIDNYDYYRYKD